MQLVEGVHIGLYLPSSDEQQEQPPLQQADPLQAELRVPFRKPEQHCDVLAAQARCLAVVLILSASSPALNWHTAHGQPVSDGVGAERRPAEEQASPLPTAAALENQTTGCLGKRRSHLDGWYQITASAPVAAA